MKKRHEAGLLSEEVLKLSTKVNQLQGALGKAEKEKRALAMDVENTRRLLQELRDKSVSGPSSGSSSGSGHDPEYQAELLEGWSTFFSVRMNPTLHGVCVCVCVAGK